jgi:hypothetical protein
MSSRLCYWALRLTIIGYEGSTQASRQVGGRMGVPGREVSVERECQIGKGYVIACMTASFIYCCVWSTRCSAMTGPTVDT